LDILLLAVSFAVILAGSELFTNGIEWFGHKLELGEGAIGSVLAAIGTALPETMVPLIAILFGGGIAASEIGVGAILGAPFMLATLAMFVTGAGVWLMRGRRATGKTLALDLGVVSHDMAYFASRTPSPIGAPSFPWSSSGRADSWPSCSSASTAAMSGGTCRPRRPSTRAFSPFGSTKLDRGAPQHRSRRGCSSSRYRWSSPCLHRRGRVDLRPGDQGRGVRARRKRNPAGTGHRPDRHRAPETLNSVLWVRRGKDTLAMGNITGAMVFQSAIPTSIGLVFAPALWTVVGGGVAFGSAAITLGFGGGDLHSDAPAQAPRSEPASRGRSVLPCLSDSWS